jgi:ribosome-binding protein aMBF1 (putative translation factor)
MALVVSDANVFIDLEEGGILAPLFRLPEAIAVPDVLFEDRAAGRASVVATHAPVARDLHRQGRRRDCRRRTCHTSRLSPVRTTTMRAAPPPGYVYATPPVKLSPGDAVRVGREVQEMTQAELAAASGIQASTISAIERGRVKLGVERAERLARALKVHPAVLLWPNWSPEEEAAE